ncbi:MAG: 50S ribosomal protein L9 [Bdellovibrionales bacterium]|jgi:large subunit ribosomal protein L9|nr:50S ribosomal protein L9 [Bdellovibrionales bacterium]MBT3526866.1 50S ribosomal protein L9 [Bdellovibrionales bacterium]MBT7669542.1 50S ribosomal protein L9 [Bdellovibrionales bacterium]MBT7765797.1 50S ribosomal protein L9 [Bdellovibrionales bacterium]
MKVILTEKIKTLGNIGEIVKVNDGYARNYLIPNQMAVLADDAHRKQLENSQRRLQKRIAEERQSAEDMKLKIEQQTIELVKKVGSNGKLFGTVTNTELSKELADRDIEVERRLIVIENPIKNLGEFDIKVKLFNEVEALFKVKVVMDPKQIEELKARQKAAEVRAKQKAEKGDEEKSEQDEADASPEGEEGEEATTDEV